MTTDITATYQSTKRRVHRNGDEVAAFTSEHRELSYRAGERRAVKRGHHRAARRSANVQLSRYTTV